VRRLFDLDADPREINDVLEEDRVLRRFVRARPGVRVPGAWDPFELAVRAVLGQQVTVAGAVTLLERLVRRYGEPGELSLFPRPKRLRRLPPTAFGVPRARGRALVELAARFDEEEMPHQLETISGIGPWTAQYVAMRAFGDPDAFPVGDLGLMRALSVNARELEARAERWRPFRAYAAMHLWNSILKERA
jgi:AraC family transcriptional regulator of adaptative response / DNA-3-methyladenine glycosylase II